MYCCLASPAQSIITGQLQQFIDKSKKNLFSFIKIKSYCAKSPRTVLLKKLT